MRIEEEDFKSNQKHYPQITPITPITPILNQTGLLAEIVHLFIPNL